MAPKVTAPRNAEGGVPRVAHRQHGICSLLNHQEQIMNVLVLFVKAVASLYSTQGVTVAEWLKSCLCTSESLLCCTGGHSSSGSEVRKYNISDFALQFSE